MRKGGGKKEKEREIKEEPRASAMASVHARFAVHSYGNVHVHTPKVGCLLCSEKSG